LQPSGIGYFNLTRALSLRNIVFIWPWSDRPVVRISSQAFMFNKVRIHCLSCICQSVKPTVQIGYTFVTRRVSQLHCGSFDRQASGINQSQQFLHLFALSDIAIHTVECDYRRAPPPVNWVNF